MSYLDTLSNRINEPNNEGVTHMAPKPAPKQAAQQTDQNHDGAEATAAAKPRDYRITKKLTLDTTDMVSVLNQLAAFAGDDADNPQPVVVYVHIGTGQGLNPKEAVKSYGSDNDMKGDYEAAAEGSIKEFKNVSTEAKRTVTFA